MTNNEELYSSLSNYLEILPSGCEKIAQMFREGNQDIAFKSINDFSDGIEWFVTITNHLNKNGYTINLEEEQLKMHLQEVNICLNNNDEVMLADLFEYELAPFFENIKIERKLS
ncbi:hypothetical protein [Paenisporosarcina cavernae]|uniref:DUF8042 domain-containing protein n=1 Tax=Paenisporosarcina cavernae TaxID=2320858 RepID=A0A385YRC3_9BACL|nr:hypothetical protein [Paenisporosarcina cavernae]AYC28950.1 hypothetical protein D3873_03335 [Paenisporosarcina cavernae]